MSKKIIAYKAMNPDMTCRGKKYEVGKTYFEDNADCCSAGMHACENPFEVLRYYPMNGNPRFFEVECGGEISKSDEGSKLACTELTVKGELNFAGMLKATLDAVFRRVKDKEPFSSGNYSTAGTSGYYSTAGTSGDYSTAGTSGDSSTAGTSGDYSTAGTSGYYSTAGTSGNYSTAGTSGYSSTAGTSGYYSTAGTSGNYSTAAATGPYCRAKAEGNNSIAVANGYKSKVKGSVGCYLVLTEYDDDGNLLCADLKLVNGISIKADTWYMLKDGLVVESE
jgi:hypothetical protein